MPSRPLSLPNRLRNVSFLLVLIAVVCVAAPFYVRRTAASRFGDQTPSLLPSSQTTIAHNYGELALSFERNDGQTSAEARFISRGPGYDLFLTATSAVLSLRKDESPATHPQKDSVAFQQSLLCLKMIGASTSANIKGDEELIGKVNYFVGNDPSRWLANIPTYAKVRYTGIFPGIDLVYYGNRTQLEYDFVLAPRANLASIKFEIDGAEKIKIGDEGDLHLATKQGEVQLRKPQIYQLSEAGAREQIDGGYQIKGRQIAFKVGAYDSRKALVIDPVLSYSTLLGTGGNEQGNSIAVDSQGNAYITGITSTGNFPTTAGAFQLTSPGSGGVFVTKLDPTGSNLIYSTYLAGTGLAFGNGIAVDAAGDAYVTGYASSADFPILNPLRGGRNNLLITTDSGSNWAPSNVGSANRAIQTLAIDRNSPSTIYAGTGLNGGIFKSIDGGATWTALNTGLTNASCPAIVIDPTSSNILYAALIAQNFGSATGVYKSIDGGNTWASSGLSGTQVSSLAIDPQNHLNLYAGTTFGFSKSINGGASWTNANTGLNFGGASAIAIDPITPSTLYTIAGGGGVFKSTNSAGNWSQVNNGLTSTTVRALVMDPSATLTLYAGTAGGGIFKTTDAGASWSPANNGPSLSTGNMSSLAIVPTSTATIFAGTFDGRILKTTNAGGNWSVVYTTTTNTGIRALAVDAGSPAKVIAAVDSTSQTLNSPDAFVTKLNPSGSALLYSTFIGGLLDDEANAIAIDASGNAYIAGLTTSSDYPTVSPAQVAFAGSQGCTDAFVTKLNSSGSALSFSTYLGGAGCDKARAIALDNSGNVYVAGETLSSNLATPGAFQTTLGAQFGRDAFAARYATNGALGYFTYLGGDGDDVGYGIATDSSGNAYVTGLTTSTNFPTANPIQPTNGGSAGDAFVTKINSTGSGLVYSTYLGGSTIDAGRGIAVDAAGSAYVTGFTSSSEFPLVAGALRTRSPFFKTIDGGGNWNNDNYGLKSDIVTALAVNPTASAIFAGTRNSLYRSTDGGRNWSQTATGLSAPSVVALVINPANPSTIYLGSSATGTGVYKSTDGGDSWNPANNGLGNAGVVWLAIDPSTPTTLYALNGGILLKTIDGGAIWNKIGPQSFSAIRLVIDPSNPSTLYAAENDSGGGVLKSTDSGANWQLVNNGLTSVFMNSVAIDPVSPSTIYAGGNGGLFKSVNGGNSWTSINNGLGGPIVIDPVTPTTVYACSNAGVSRSTDGGATWAGINNGLRVPFISALTINPGNTSTLYAGVNAFIPDDDAFVVKVSPQGTSLVYSTLLGGVRAANDSLNYNDEAFAIALDSTGSAYVTGISRSPDFPVNQNSYQPFNRGFDDAFVSKLTMSYLISGQVLDGNNAPISGAEVTLSDGSSLTSVVTESDGSYQFSRLREGGNFTVSAAKPHFTMAPASQTFNNLTSNQTQNFVATSTNAPFFTVSGQITNNNTGLKGVTVTLSGSQPSFRTTDGNGNFSFTLAGGGNYTVTPSILGFSFNPSSQTFNNLSADQTASFAATRQNFVVTNANDHGMGSLRQAILDANATQGLDTITFNITGSGVQTINLLIALPTITDPVVIDATTQPGYSGSPLIELNGAQTSGNGFQITAGNSTIRGFIINRFTSGGAAGILLNTNGGNTIQGNFIGTDSTGNVARNNYNGIQMSGSSNNLIGGTTAAARNVISGSNFDAIFVNGAGNQIQGNFIGTNAAGTAAIPTGTNGIEVSGSPSVTNNIIGGTVAGAGNLISGNPTGVNLFAPGNTVQGNLIGTDLTGKKSVPNGVGVNASAANSTVGGTVVSARNVISGNNGDGVLFGGSGSVLQGNFIGTDITGSVVLGNGGNGVTSGSNALIGGTVAGARNIISGNGATNGFANVALGLNSFGPSTVQGNYIGTDVTGSVALTNPKAGIAIGSSSNVIGGLTPEARNVISGNTVGIEIGGSTTGSVASNLVQGNFIGLNQAGTAGLPNSSDGIRISALNIPPVGNNTIGGTAAGAGNVIAFNGGRGVMVSSGTGNSIRGNSIVSNSSLGIDLAPAGLTANDQGDADTGANNRQNFPILTSLTPASNPNTITGTLNSSANTAFTIDVYANTSCDPLGNGEGSQYLASTNVTTGADGNVAINFTLASALPPGTIVTATATDPAGNTSEFSPCVMGATFSFSQSTYSVNESNGSLNVTVNRRGGTAGPMSVDYASSDGGASAVPCSTANGKASSKCDFTDAVGTLNFAAGETSKTITLLISQDNYVEGAETLTIGLANASLGALIVSPSTATITINDDTTEPPGNAIDEAANFVRQHYHDFLNREPDQSGLDFWTDQITSCGSDAACTEVRRINVSAAFFLSIEFQQTGYLVERMYKTAYGDATGTSTLVGSHQLAVPIVRFNEFLTDTQRISRGVVVLAPGWEQALENNKQAYAGEFVATSRFITAFPTTMTPAQFVDKLNQNAGNVLSLSERTTAINLFGGATDSSNTTARAQALRQVAEDQDLYNAEFNRAFVLTEFFGYLRRNPNDLPDQDYTGYDFWLTKLNQFNGDYIAAEMVKAFIASSEYRQRFGP